MADLLARLPLTTFPPPGLYGAVPAAIRLRVVQPALATVSAARGQSAALTAASLRSFGAPLVDGPCVSGNETLSHLGIGPGRWLAVDFGGDRLVERLEEAFGAAAVICEQSDGYVVFAAEGPPLRECLAKGPSIDFRPSVFKPGTVATTVMAHIGLTIWQPPVSETFFMAVPASYAPSFARMFFANAAEFGIDFA